MSEHHGLTDGFDPAVPGQRSRPGVGLAAYALPFLSSAAMVLWLTRPEDPGESARLRVEVVPEATESARIFSGEGAWRGGRLSARLSPAQPEAQRREFDNQALTPRLAAGAGQAWHLELRWMPEASKSAERGPAVDAAPLTRIAIVDAYGEALQPLQAGPGQPLRALFAAPTRLPLDEPQHLLLWGRAPAGGVRLEWVSDDAEALYGLDLTAAREDSAGLPESLVGWAPAPSDTE